MKNMWRVAAYEYRRNVFKKTFLFTLVSVPFFIAFSIGMGIFMESRGNSSQPVGVVDHAGVLDPELISPDLEAAWQAGRDRPLEFIAFQTEQAAGAALQAKEIQAYFILPESYPLTGHVEVVFNEEPGEMVWKQFYDLLRLHMLSGQPAQVALRAVSGVDFIVRSIDGRREVPADSGPTFGLLMPLFIAIGFVSMILMSSGYTMSALADEKENRTMEVLVTTVSPLQVVGGKILGITAIGLTLLFTWVGMVVLGIFICRQAGIPWFNDLSMDWSSVLATLAIAIPAYVLATAVMTAIGVMVSTTQEGSSVSTIVFVLHVLPLYSAVAFLDDPNSSLAVLLSVLPFTSLVVVGIRNLFTIVPAWQVALSVGIQCISAVAAIWLAGRAFRFGMLRYGQKLSLRHLFGQRVRG